MIPNGANSEVTRLVAVPAVETSCAMTTPSLFQHVPKGGLRPLDVFFGKNGANKLAASS